MMGMQRESKAANNLTPWNPSPPNNEAKVPECGETEIAIPDSNDCESTIAIPDSNSVHRSEDLRSGEALTTSVSSQDHSTFKEYPETVAIVSFRTSLLRTPVTATSQAHNEVVPISEWTIASPVKSREPPSEWAVSSPRKSDDPSSSDGSVVRNSQRVGCIIC